MTFAHAGCCGACLPEDLLFAKAEQSGNIFFVCAACAAAGDNPSTSNLSPQEQTIIDLHAVLAPAGWTLALRIEAESVGYGVASDASETYQQLIGWYPGFHERSV